MCDQLLPKLVEGKKLSLRYWRVKLNGWGAGSCQSDSVWALAPALGMSGLPKVLPASRGHISGSGAPVTVMVLVAVLVQSPQLAVRTAVVLWRGGT